MKNKTAKSANVYMLFLLLYQIFLLNGIVIIVASRNLDVNIVSLQIIFQLLLFLVPFLIYVYSTRLPLSKILHTNRIGLVNTVLIILIMFFFQPLLSLIAQISAYFWQDTVTEQVAAMHYSAPLWVVLVTTSLVPAVCEEITFRGIIYRNIKNHSSAVKIILSSFFFAIIHLNPQQFGYAFIAGILLAFMLNMTHSIFSPMLAHFTLNGSQTILAYFSSTDSEISYEFSEVLLSTLQLNLIALPIFALLIFLFIRHNKKRNPFFYAGLEDDDIDDSDIEIEGLAHDTVYPFEENKFTVFTWDFWAIIIIYVLYCFIL